MHQEISFRNKDLSFERQIKVRLINRMCYACKQHLPTLIYSQWFEWVYILKNRNQGLLENTKGRYY